MATIDRESLISEKQNNKVSTKGAKLPKGAKLLRDIFKFTKPFWNAFRYLDSSTGLSKSQEIPPIALTLIFKNNIYIHSHNKFLQKDFYCNTEIYFLSYQNIKKTNMVIIYS